VTDPATGDAVVIDTVVVSALINPDRSDPEVSSTAV